MSNSPLVSYTKISPNRTSPRNHAIDTITIHMVVGQLSVETLGDIFAPTSRKASSNYGVGYDGRIGMYVEEKDRSWCSSSSSNDNRAITIEVASDKTHPYAVNDTAMNALVNLLVDICKRNNIKQLLWKNDKSLIGQVDKQNMTLHKWFSNTSCPGEYLHNKHGEIANRVNALLNETKEKKTMYKVQICDSIKTLEEAKSIGKKVKEAGFDCYIITETQEPVQVDSAPTPAPTPAPVEKKIAVGSKVKIKDGAKSYEGVKMASYVYGKVYTVDDLKGDRAVLDKNGICTAFHVNDLIIS